MNERPFPGYVHGAEAARLFGVARADSVWRAIQRHGEEYPGRIEVVEFGRMKMVRREDLVAFTAWFAAGMGARDTRVLVGDSVPAEREEPAADPRPRRSGAVTDARRAQLARQIARLTGM